MKNASNILVPAMIFGILMPGFSQQTNVKWETIQLKQKVFIENRGQFDLAEQSNGQYEYFPLVSIDFTCASVNS